LYRLRQVDFDGAYEYSNAEVVTFDKLVGIKVHPNPAKETLTIRLTKASRVSSEVTLSNMLGQPLEVVSIQSRIEQVKIDVLKYTAGIYYVQVVQGIQTQMVKILVDK